MNNEIFVSIHRAKDIIISLNEIEGIIKILAINDTLKENMMDRITGIREILKEAKLKGTI